MGVMEVGSGGSGGGEWGEWRWGVGGVEVGSGGGEWVVVSDLWYS